MSKIITINFEPGNAFASFIRKLDYEGRYRQLQQKNPCRKTRALPPLPTFDVNKLRAANPYRRPVRDPFVEITDEEVVDAVKNLYPHFLDLVITAANVSWSGTTTNAGTVAGATITAGQSLYTSTTPNYQLAKADTAAHAATTGIALTNAASGQLLPVANSGVITVSGATFTTTTPIVVSGANAGGIAPYADLTAGMFLTFLGWVASATTLQISINATGLAHP